MTTVLESLNQALHGAMGADESVYLLGEDMLDPYGGAFKVSKGLSTAYPERVLTTPVSEAGMVGIAGGMALRGLRPVVEIMFGDFTTLIADQLINSISKFRWMYNDQVTVPLVVRTPMGGRRGYGPTHSQTMEKYFLGAPGLKVVAPCALGNPGELLKQVILEENDPVLFVENKLLYLQKVMDEAALAEFESTEYLVPGEYPSYELTVRGAPPPVITIAAYGYMAELAREAAQQLAFEHEIFVQILIPTQLSFEDNLFIEEILLPNLERSQRLLTVEEGTLSMGWGAEVITRASHALGPKLQKVGRVAAAEIPIPASVPMERAMLPQVEDIVAAARSMV
ncbi:MAG: alpha-ketoacid dehydrogenase subunit beta [Chloroflexi bacterium]|nr:MAG: alpha-ketoacid dehydrogenase subunit beta [Chloroflexota bacterium]MBL1196310.1 alpha-ketoacid dehydrogenase subunit beta [Chloroflexota bacterium]NOH13605.1 alpha-ketoacid dehydrogenase subunit beta [Chloroflexota bacterium]